MLIKPWSGEGPAGTAECAPAQASDSNWGPILRRLQIQEVQAGHTELINQVFCSAFTQTGVHACEKMQNHRQWKQNLMANKLAG